jgi:molecular chaperone GrpE
VVVDVRMPEEPPSAEAKEEPGDSAPPPKPVPPAEDWEKRFTYLYADFENFRRRTGRERETLRAQAQAEVLKGVLPIAEAAEKAVEAVHSRPAKDPVRKGIEMLERSVSEFLSAQGVQVVGTAGEEFRPEEHEAVGETAASASAPDGHVAEVVQRGYSFPGGLLRPAKVVVARRPAKAPPPVEETEELSDPGDPAN